MQGLFLTARDLLLTDAIQLEAVDELLCGLSDEDFMLLLPQLRLAFSYFTPTEAAPEEYTLWESVDAWAAERLEPWSDPLNTEGGMEA